MNDKIILYLKILEVKERSPPEELEKAFKRLAKKYHPDLGGEAKKFIQIKEAFDFLKINYNQNIDYTPKPKEKLYNPEIKSRERYFRVLNPYQTTHTISFPEATLQADISIICMWKGEFKLNFDKGTVFPKTIKLNRPPLTIKIIPDIPWK